MTRAHDDAWSLAIAAHLHAVSGFNRVIGYRRRGRTVNVGDHVITAASAATLTVLAVRRAGLFHDSQLQEKP